MDDFSERLSKCYTGAIHDIMRAMGYKNFVLPPEIRPTKNDHVLAGKIFTMEGEVNKSTTEHETLLEWTGFLSKAPKGKVVICQPNTNEIALMGELSAEVLQLRGVKGYIVDGGARDMDFIIKIDYPLWFKFFTPKDVVNYWKPTKYETDIKIGDVKISNDDYVLADIDGVIIIPQNIIEEVLIKTEEVINTENLLRKAIREGEDPQEAYLKYGVF
jgi:regulator of RNase E activity RraA